MYIMHAMAKDKTTTAKPTQCRDSVKTIPGRNGGTLTPFQPGQSGNPNGCSFKSKPLTTEYLSRLNDGEKGAGLAQEMIDIALKAARKGDFRFWQELMNRSDGKVTDHVQHSGRVDSLITQEKFEDMDNERKRRLLDTAGLADVPIPGDGADTGAVDTG